MFNNTWRTIQRRMNPASQVTPEDLQKQHDRALIAEQCRQFWEESEVGQYIRAKIARDRQKSLEKLAGINPMEWELIQAEQMKLRALNTIETYFAEARAEFNQATGSLAAYARLSGVSN